MCSRCRCGRHRRGARHDGPLRAASEESPPRWSNPPGQPPAPHGTWIFASCRPAPKHTAPPIAWRRCLRDPCCTRISTPTPRSTPSGSHNVGVLPPLPAASARAELCGRSAAMCAGRCASRTGDRTRNRPDPPIGRRPMPPAAPRNSVFAAYPGRPPRRRSGSRAVPRPPRQSRRIGRSNRARCASSA